MAMGSWQMLLFPFLIILVHFPNITTAQVPSFLYYFCTNSANYTTNSTYQSNLNAVLSSLASNTSNNYGFFYNTSAGQDPDTVHTIALCRGDVYPYECRDCVTDATIKLREMCPNQKEAIGWYDECMLRYSNASIFHRVEEGNTFYMWNVNNVSSFGEFNAALGNLTDKLQAEAATGGSLRKFAMGKITGPDFLMISGLMQCTPDLSEPQCRSCLSNATRQIPSCCNGKQGGRVIGPSCSLRYESGSGGFIDDYEFSITLPSPPLSSAPPSRSPPPPLLPPPAQYSKSKSFNRRRVAGLVILSVATVVLILLAAFWFARKKQAMQRQPEVLFNFNTSTSLEGSSMRKEMGENGPNTDLHTFDLSVLVAATGNFAIVNKLGEGGFGSVFKGQLPNGQEIAVKRLSKSSGQGMEEFKNEVTLIAKLQHRNLVRLLGCCIQKEEKMLVYEYLPNKGLDCFIFNKDNATQLDWRKRFDIILGIVRGLLYLHHDSRLRIIHRDLKASNVLLDAALNPKISDFGMARIFGGDQVEAITRRVVGTYGYMSPEYAMEGMFSIKSDVFSLGVLLLEIISGRKNNSYFQEKSINLIGHVWELWREGKTLSIVDPSMGESYEVHEVLRCIHVSLLCVQELAKDRPTMSEIAFMLCNDTNLRSPNQPAFVFGKSSCGTNSTSASGGTISINEATMTVVEAR